MIPNPERFMMPGPGANPIALDQALGEWAESIRPLPCWNEQLCP